MSMADRLRELKAPLVALWNVHFIESETTMFLRIVSGQVLHICGLAIVLGSIAVIASDASAQEKSCGSCHPKLWPNWTMFKSPCRTACGNHAAPCVYPSVWQPSPQEHIASGPLPLTPPVQAPAGQQLPNPRPADGRSVPKQLPIPDGAKPSSNNPQP